MIGRNCALYLLTSSTHKNHSLNKPPPKMPRSPKRTAKTQSKTKSKSKETSTKSRIVPTTPFSDVSNLLLPPTPRVIDFALSLPEPENGHHQDGWSSDDSFEEKITWSRHRVRTIPGGCTPRNIQVPPHPDPKQN